MKEIVYTIMSRMGGAKSGKWDRKSRIEEGKVELKKEEQWGKFFHIGKTLLGGRVPTQ